MELVAHSTDTASPNATPPRERPRHLNGDEDSTRRTLGKGWRANLHVVLQEKLRLANAFPLPCYMLIIRRAPFDRLRRWFLAELASRSASNAISYPFRAPFTRRWRLLGSILVLVRPRQPVLVAGALAATLARSSAAS